MQINGIFQWIFYIEFQIVFFFVAYIFRQQAITLLIYIYAFGLH